MFRGMKIKDIDDLLDANFDWGIGGDSKSDKEKE